MLRDFERWPQYKNLYIKAFEKMIANHPGEIKVASGELAESNGGVERYTQDGSTGVSDGDGFFDQWRAESDAESGEAASTHTHTHTHTTARPQCELERTGRSGQQNGHSLIGSISSDGTVERERERERRAAPPRMVDVDAPGAEIFGGTTPSKSPVPYNPDPRVADDESAEEVMELFLNA